MDSVTSPIKEIAITFYFYRQVTAFPVFEKTCRKLGTDLLQLIMLMFSMITEQQQQAKSVKKVYETQKRNKSPSVISRLLRGLLSL